jgi:hypothetical protein
MKVIFLDHDGVICLLTEWGGREKKRKKYIAKHGHCIYKLLPVDCKFDNFNSKAIKVLNEILEETGAEIIISSDWRHHCTLEEMGQYYESQGIIKKPIGYTPNTLPAGLPFFHRHYELEETRSYEIQHWLKEHPEVTHWVAVDDLNMFEKFGDVSGNYQWGLKNFVLTPLSAEGIKQSGIKEKIINFLK